MAQQGGGGGNKLGGGRFTGTSPLPSLPRGRSEGALAAALLLFLHRIVMWVATFPLYFCCQTTAGPGKERATAMDAICCLRS